VRIENAAAVAHRVVIQSGAKRPEEAGDARQAHPDRDRDQDRQHVHGDHRTALSLTLSEDSGALKKKLGLTVTSEKIDGLGRVYRLAD
jgi:hypothetical protein